MKTLAIAIPSSVVSDTPHLREKTSKIGLIGRAAAIFRVNEVIIYPDDPKNVHKSDMHFIALLLSYLETPQYLRKLLFKLEPPLKFAGILPPLRTPHHPLNRNSKDLQVGEYREGVTLSETGEGTLVEIGVERPAILKKRSVGVGKRLTVRVARVKNLEVYVADGNEAPDYRGYTVNIEQESFGRMTRRREFDLKIATSKCGQAFNRTSGVLREKWFRRNHALIAFGAPSAGLQQIVGREGLRLGDVVDFVVNTIPFQGTETVRTEEALISTLALFTNAFARSD